MHEPELKSRLIDHLLSHNRSDIVAITGELLFANSRRRADIVVIGEHLHGFEIKGERDNTRKLPEQINDYIGCFDFTTVVTTKKHFDATKRLTPLSVGILLFDKGFFTVARRPIQRKILNKGCLISFLDRKAVVDLLKSVNVSAPRASTLQELRCVAVKKLRQTEIRKAAIEYLTSRHAPRYADFLHERGSITHPEDLMFLTERPRDLI